MRGFYTFIALFTKYPSPKIDILINPKIKNLEIFPSLGCSINLLISCACVPIHIERMVRGNIPRKPADRKLRSLVPENENNTFVTAKGNTGDNLARRIILNSSFCRLSKICFTFGFCETSKNKYNRPVL